MTLARKFEEYQGGVAKLQPQSARLRRGHRGQDRSRKQQPTTMRITFRDMVGPQATDGSGRQDAEGWDRPCHLAGLVVLCPLLGTHQPTVEESL